MTGDGGFRPGQRLWTPWRMAYVAGSGPRPDCVFCAAASGFDDVGSLVLHRGESAFVIMNLYPYNTGHLMVVPYEHASDPAALSAATRAEMAELTASFTTGLRTVMGCDGLNLGMNLGSAAGAGIADHLHQHLVPRWIGDANFMPLVGGTKVLPELLPATYGKLRAELVRQRTRASRAALVLLSPTGDRVHLRENRLPRIDLASDQPIWKAVADQVQPLAETLALLGWAGHTSTLGDDQAEPALAYTFEPTSSATGFTVVSVAEVASIPALASDRAIIAEAAARRIS